MKILLKIPCCRTIKYISSWEKQSQQGSSSPLISQRSVEPAKKLPLFPEDEGAGAEMIPEDEGAGIEMIPEDEGAVAEMIPEDDGAGQR